MSSNKEISKTGGSTNGLLPAFQAPEHLDVYDIRNTSYDVQLSVTTLTGLINRQQPRVYLLSNSDAAFWLDAAFAQVPHDISAARDEAALEALLNGYRNRVAGLIIYDANFMDSVNVATTLAGQRDCMVVSPVQAETLQGPPHHLPVVADLRIYQWKSRVQAYLWAERNLLKSASPNLVAGLDPKIAGALRSFLVATRAFVYWLDARNVLPNIRNGWIAERHLMKRILKAFAPGTPHLGWFVDEGQGVRLTSKAALPVLASDHFFNLEVWTSVQIGQANLAGENLARTNPEASPAGTNLAPARGATTFPLSEATPARDVVAGLASARPPEAEVAPIMSPKAYVSFTISDGDNLQYDQHRMAQLWQDPARGSIPIGWTISPALVRVAPALAAYYARTATPNDELVAGPSGAGYMLPSYWPAERLPAFLQLTGELMQEMNLRVIEALDTGSFLSMAFVNQSLQQVYAKALAPFGVRGVLSGAGQTRSSWNNAAGIPVLQNLGLAGSVGKTVNLVRDATLRAETQTASQFLNVYILAWSMTPSDLRQVMQQLGSEYEVVTPGRLMTMIEQTFQSPGNRLQ
jgi:hypothetical protein